VIGWPDYSIQNCAKWESEPDALRDDSRFRLGL
jgi:hypothetical protein